MRASEIGQVSLRDVFIVIFKHKYIILLFFLAVVITVSVGTFLAKPTYEASAQILVKLGRESLFVPASADMRPVVNSNREERINSEIEILKSRSLAEKVALALGPTVIYENLRDQKPGLVGRIKALIIPREEKELTPDERQELNLNIATSILQDNLEVEGIKKSNIVNVSFQHSDPRMVAMVVNNLAEIYLDHHLAVHKIPRSHKFFQEQSETLKAQLTQSEEKLKALKKQHNITSLAEERSLQLAQTSQLGAEFNKTSSQIVETEKRIRQIRKQLAATPRTIAQGEETNSNQELISTLEGRLVELELEEKQLLAKYTDQSRRVKNVREEIAIVKRRLAAQEKKSY
ncbi:MAG: Wzz/FepE/Etk N-terminal domain-containing protein, partial [Desulfobacterales bacterium]